MQKEIITPTRNGNVILHTDPLLQSERLSITIVRRFWEKVKKTDSCWLWGGEKDLHGGVIARGGQKGGTIGARKLSWLIHFSVAPTSRIRNTCNNSFCVNFEHLRLRDGETTPNRDESTIQRANALNAFDPSVHDYTSQDPTLPEGFSNTFRERFWSNVDKTSSPNGCWLWTAGLQSDGYGCIGKGRNQKGNIIKAHQASWIMANGPVPKDLVLRHKCPGGANKKCVNPAHLLVGTHKQNREDSIEEIHDQKIPYWNASLTIEQVTEVRQLSVEGVPNVEIARRTGISSRHVSSIKNRRCWTQIP